MRVVLSFVGQPLSRESVLSVGPWLLTPSFLSSPSLPPVAYTVTQGHSWQEGVEADSIFSHYGRTDQHITQLLTLTAPLTAS